MIAIPQLLTGSRLALGAAALIAAVDGNLYLAATLISLGAVTDGLDGFAARRLGVTSPFGALFDYFADYLCYVVAPWALARALLGPGASLAKEAALALPLLTAALRYARNGLIVADPSQEGRDVPGLGTVFFAFLIVAAVFLDGPRLIGERFSTGLLFFIVAFSILMVAPLRYPKMTRFPGMAPIVLVLVAIMPFIGTQALAGSMFVVGLLYPIVSPLFLRRSRPISRSYDARAHQIR